MHALDVLEYPAILQRLASHCETPLGASLAEGLKPSWQEAEVWVRLEETEEAYQLHADRSVPSLGHVRDLRMAWTRAEKGGVLGGHELFQIGECLAALRNAHAFLKTRQEDAPKLWALVQHFPDESKLESILMSSLESDGEVKDAASPTLATLRKRKAGAAARIQERIQSYVSGKTREYLSDPLYTVRDGRFVIPVKSEHRGKIKGILHDTSGSGQTVYIEPEDVLALGNQLREIEGLEREEIQRILAELSSRVGAVGPQGVPAIEDAAALDLAYAKGRLAYDMEAAMPEKGAPGSIKIDQGRHPMLDQTNVVPVSIEVGTGFEGLLITGPNTGGKTVAIKCVGLFVLMAQTGLFVPARECRLGPFTQVWADIGDEQSIAQSLSTFSGHIRNIAEALGKLKSGALALFDEIGAGTDPAEGAALARAILRAFRDKGARIVASTHYGELKAFAYSEPGFQNAAMEFDVKSLRPTYRLLMGAPGASHALRIAERYGIPQPVIEAAKGELGTQHQDLAAMLENLEQAQRQARAAQGRADQLAAELKRKEEAAAKKLEEADEIRRKASQRATEQIEDTLREIRLQAAEIIDELKKAGGSAQAIEAARAQLKAVQEIGDEEIKKRKVSDPRPKPNVSAAAIAKGMSVRVEGYSQVGVVLTDPKNGQVQVQLGPLKLNVAVAKLRAEAPTAPTRPRVKQSFTLEKAATAKTEISLRGMKAEDAVDELQRFIDDAILGGIHQARIVHGKGEGILRKIVHDMLKRQRGVTGFRLGEPAEGGDGVTIASFG